MKVTVFAKKRKTEEGRAFTSYVAKLEKKDGTELSVGVKFREECGAPKAESCPMIIEIPKEKANLSPRSYTDPKTGEVKTSYDLWVSEWKESAEKYVDHSLDEFV